jgi:hypothetical protein
MRHEAKINASQNYELPGSLVSRVSSIPSSPARPLPGPSDLTALLSSLPGIVIMVVGFLLLFGPRRRPNLGAGLLFLGIAVMFAALAFLSLSPLSFSSLRSLQFQQTTEQRNLVDRPQFLEPVDYESLAVASSDPGSLDKRALTVSGGGRYAVEPLRNMGLNLPEILIFGAVLIFAGGRWSNWGIAHSHGTAHITGWLVMLAGFFIFLINIIPILARFVPRGSS